MNTTPFPSRWVSMPMPILIGVMATWIPLSVPVMAGLVTGTVIYAGLNLMTNQETETVIP